MVPELFRYDSPSWFMCKVTYIISSLVRLTLDEHMPMQYTEIFSAEKIVNLIRKNFVSFNMLEPLGQNIDCMYMLEPPQQGGSNEYPQSLFWIKNKEIRHTPIHPSFTR